MQGMSYSNSGYPGNQPNSDPWGSDPAQPGSQPSAGHPGSQSGGYPSSQSSGGYPSSQSSAGYPDSQSAYNPQSGYAGSQQSYPPPAYADQQSSYPTQQIPAQTQQWTPQPPRSHEDNFFKTIFDFGFTRYATPSVVKILYILGIVVGGLGWLLSGLFWIGIGGAMTALNPYASGGGGTTLIAVLSWLFGLIPLFFWIIGLRVSLEYALAVIRINQDTKVIREKMEA